MFTTTCTVDQYLLFRSTSDLVPFSLDIALNLFFLGKVLRGIRRDYRMTHDIRVACEVG
jgi:hypothetical protein